jgi:precorrin-3B synthase
VSAPARPHRRVLPETPARRGWCPGLARPMPTGDGLLARVHPPLGMLTRDQARAVAEGARRFGNGHLDLTARANLQIRGVSEASRAPLARLLEAAGLGDARADGGPQRLTLTSPLCGHDPAEVIDVAKLAAAIEAEGRAIMGLPAKTLVVVEGRPDVELPDADCLVMAQGGDSVVVAASTEGGRRDLAACAVEEAPGMVAALLAAFVRTGRRRMRELTDADWVAVAGSLRAGLFAEAFRAARDGELAARARARRVVPFAPSAGLRAAPEGQILAIDAPFGRCTADGLDQVADAADTVGADRIRLSPTRGFVLFAPPGAEAAAAMAGLAEAFIVAPADPRRGIDACTGAPGCASGSTPTLADAARLAAAFQAAASRPRTAHVSGCAKCCARPGPADLTLVGRDGRYGVVIGGAPGHAPGLHLPIEAVLERLGRAKTVGLAAAFAPDGDLTGCGRTRRPA